MAEIDIPLPGKDKDYDSRKSRAKLINLMVDVNNDGSFKAIVKREGSEFVLSTTDNDPIVSNLWTGNDGAAYFAGVDRIYSISPSLTLTDYGLHNLLASSVGEIRVSNNNAVPPEYIFSASNVSTGDILSGGVITAIADVDYTGKSPSSPTHLNSRFYLIDNTSENDFFASEVLDGGAYDPLAFAAADEESGSLLQIRSYKSALWAFKTRNIEYWQTFNDTTFPLRRVQGASKRIGLAAPTGLDQLYESIGFVGSDLKVYMMTGQDIQLISDIDFSLEITNTGNIATVPYCFFIDGPNHRYFGVTSFDNNPIIDLQEFTWVYDQKTGQSHYRTSPGVPYWDVRFSAYLQDITNNEIIYSHLPFLPASSTQDEIWRLDPNLFTDNGVDFDCIMQSGSMSFKEDVTIEYIEIEMETGVGNIDSADPEMTVEYSKDGGVNFVTWGVKKLGGSTDKSNRIRMNNFGRLVRHTDFVLKLTITEPVRVEFYGAYAEITGGF